MLNTDIAEFYAMILSLVTTRRKIMRIGTCVGLTMALARRLMMVNLRISPTTNARILLALCLEAMLVNIAI
jgi:hypothetical protein